MDVTNLINTLNQAASSTDITSGITDAERQEIYQACQKLTSRVESPIDRVIKTVSDFTIPVVFRIAIDLGIFDIFIEPDREFDIPEIAEHAKCNELLISRVMRFLVAFHIVDVTPEGKCRANSFTKNVQPGTLARVLIITFSSVFGPALVKLPDFLRRNGNAVPESAYKGAFQEAWGTELHMFDWLAEHKTTEIEALHLMMAAKPSHHGSMWTDLIPDQWISGIIPSDADDSRAFTIVDVGTSSGIVLDAFSQRLPEQNFRLILQDLPGVIEGISNATSMCQMTTTAGAKIEKMDHDFFTPQPVKGANVYIVARNLHDWPDKEALKILKHVQAAMNEQSILIIYDCVFSDKLEVVSERDAVADFGMMAALSSLERTEGQLVNLLQLAGLRLTNMWRSPLAGAKHAVLAVSLDNQVSR